MNELILRISSQYGINPNWVKALISHESSWNQYAVRYEKNYQWLFKPEKFAKDPLISLNTEIETQKMSWGFGQIMGAVAREHGNVGFMSELLKPEINIEYVCKYLKWLKGISDKPDDVFAMYNGGPAKRHKVNGRYSNQPYVNSVLGYLQKFGSSVMLNS
jgi:soluble lytic murein transglycosylase-like protein